MTDDFLTIDELIKRCEEINKLTNDNIKCMNIMTDKDKNELDKISLKYFKSDLVKIHKLEFKKELSFLNALSYCLITKYKLLSEEQKENYIENNFIIQILKDLRKKNGMNKYITPTFAIDKSIINSGFKQKKINDNHIRFLSIFFNINIFIIKENINTAKTGTLEQYITILYTRNKTFNIFKHSIILFYDKNNDLYYPLSINNQTIFIYTKDEIFKKFLDNNIVFIEQINNLSEVNYETLSKIYDNDIENIEENKYNLLKDKNKSSIDTISSSTTTTITTINNHLIIDKNINNIKNDKNDKDDKDIIEDNEDKNEDKDKNNDNDDNDEEKEEENDNNSNSIEEIKTKKHNIKPNINKVKINKSPDISKYPENEENINTITTEQAIMNVLEPQKINKYSKDELEQLPVIELKKLLKENKIKQSYKDEDGKTKQKTRSKIIDDLLQILQ